MVGMTHAILGRQHGPTIRAGGSVDLVSDSATYVVGDLGCSTSRLWVSVSPVYKMEDNDTLIKVL